MLFAMDQFNTNLRFVTLKIVHLDFLSEWLIIVYQQTHYGMKKIQQMIRIVAL